MLKAKLFFTRRQGADDIIQLYEDDTFFEMVRVVYTPGDHAKKSNEFYLTRSAALEYIDSILSSMGYDADPFDFVQLQTAIHPSILFSVSDVSVRSTRTRIDEMVNQSLKATVSEISLKRTVRSPVENW
jgi:hypothetical protein